MRQLEIYRHDGFLFFLFHSVISFLYITKHEQTNVFILFIFQACIKLKKNLLSVHLEACCLANMKMDSLVLFLTKNIIDKKNIKMYTSVESGNIARPPTLRTNMIANCT